MGMYTELVLGVRLRDDTPSEILDLLDAMVKGEVDAPPASVAAHPLFSTERWSWMLQSGGSAYFQYRCQSSFDRDRGEITLNVRINIKNYGNEIDHFCDFIAPYVHKLYNNDLAGYERLEESVLPTLLYFRDGKAEWHAVECPTLAEID